MTIDWPQLAGAGAVARHIEPSDDLEAEFVQLGRNLANKCRATFVVQIEAQTSDPTLLAAAERGRREVLEAGAVDGTPWRCTHCDLTITAIAGEVGDRCPAWKMRWAAFRRVDDLEATN